MTQIKTGFAADAWSRVSIQEEQERRRAKMLEFGKGLLGQEVKVTEEFKVWQLINRPRIPQHHPRDCITPSGMRGKHGTYGEMREEKFVCAFCGRTLWEGGEKI